MHRITQCDLDGLLKRFVHTTGAKTHPLWTKRADGSNRATVGAVFIEPGSQTYGNAWMLAQMVNEGGGQRTILRGSTARELYDAMHNYLNGYDDAVRKVNP